jgi:hypothetical protein
MRPDMAKVIVERPRVGGLPRKRRYRYIAFADLPRHEGMRRPHLDFKTLNENLSPLRRYLHAQAGRPWNKVFAEISAHLRPDSTVQQHVRDHLADFVAIRTRLVDGRIVVVDTGRFGSYAPEPLEDAYRDLYVHPVTGVLLVNRHGKRRAAQRRGRNEDRDASAADRRRVVAPLLQLHKLRGCWFEVRLAAHAGSLPVARWSPLDGATPLDAVIDAGMSDLDRLALYGRKDVYAVSKRQLGRREMRRYGLSGD